MTLDKLVSLSECRLPLFKDNKHESVRGVCAREILSLYSLLPSYAFASARAGRVWEQGSERAS